MIPLSKIDTSNLWAFIPQILTIVPIIWYTFTLVKVFHREAKNELNQQGAIPVLAIGYIVLGYFFIGNFILNFGDFISKAEFAVRFALDDRCDNPRYYILMIDILMSLILLAFTVNFLKALYTLNSLDFGILGKKISLKEIYELNSGNSVLFRIKEVIITKKQIKALIEFILRISIAFLFIVLEKKLASSDILVLNKPINNSAEGFIEDSTLSHLGLLGICLFGFMIGWYLLFRFWFDKEKQKLDKFWFKNTFTQFLFGFFVCLVLFFLGNLTTYDRNIVRIILPLSMTLGIVFPLILIFSVVRNEYFIWIKNGRN